MKKSDASQGQPAAELISERIAELGDWRGETLAQNAQADQGGRPGRRRGVEVAWALRCGRTTASSAPANPTRRS